MLDLSDRRRRGGIRLDVPRPEGETPVEVVTHRGKAYLRSVGTAARTPQATPPGIEHQAPFAVGVFLLAGMIVATVAFMAASSATFDAATRALPEGSLTAPRSEAGRELANERDRRREALIAYDRHIAGAADDSTLQETRRDLKRREVETVRQLDEQSGEHPRDAHAPGR